MKTFFSDLPFRNALDKKPFETEQTPVSEKQTGPAYASIIQRKTTCPCGGGCPQCKPVIGNPGDKYEKEADAEAERVINTKESCLQTRQNSMGSENMKSIWADEKDHSSGQGQCLSPNVSHYLESQFKSDLSNVRIHTGAKANSYSKALNANAFTSGHDIFFGEGQYQPQTTTGQKLLAHELTHVVQQKKGISAGVLPDSPGNIAAHPVIQRQPAGAKKESEQEGSGKDDVVEDKRAGTLINEIVINIDDGRVVFLTSQGPAILGTGGTDLKPGLYEIEPDFQRQRWVIKEQGILVGQRFVVNLDGALPWTLAYPDSLNLLVTFGFKSKGENSLAQTKERIIDLVDNKQYQKAFEHLAVLTEVDLAHLLSILNRDHQAALLMLMTNFKVAVEKNVEPYRLLVAIESVVSSEENLYIDNFSNYYVDPSSFGEPDEERVKQKKWNVKIYFTYNLTPDRGITVYADDIADSGGQMNSRPHYGPGGLLYPNTLNKGTVPRMWAAKQEVIKKIEEGNIEFILTAHAATESVMGLVMLGQGLMVSTIPGATTGMVPRTRGLSRPVTEAFKKQPGKWMDDFEGGSNMSAEALAYEARVCHKDPARGYYVKNTQFDGFENGTLLDAKHYPANKGMAQALEQNNYFIGTKLLNQARRQLSTAGRTPVEWRVSNPAAANKIRQLFNTNQINIKVTFYP